MTSSVQQHLIARCNVSFLGLLVRACPSSDPEYHVPRRDWREATEIGEVICRRRVRCGGQATCCDAAAGPIHIFR